MEISHPLEERKVEGLYICLHSNFFSAFLALFLSAFQVFRVQLDKLHIALSHLSIIDLLLRSPPILPISWLQSVSINLTLHSTSSYLDHYDHPLPQSLSSPRHPPPRPLPTPKCVLLLFSSICAAAKKTTTTSSPSKMAHRDLGLPRLTVTRQASNRHMQ